MPNETGMDVAEAGRQVVSLIGYAIMPAIWCILTVAPIAEGRSGWTMATIFTAAASFAIAAFCVGKALLAYPS